MKRTTMRLTDEEVAFVQEHRSEKAFLKRQSDPNDWANRPMCSNACGKKAAKGNSFCTWCLKQRLTA